MKKLTVYNVYLEDGDGVYKITTPAENEKDAANYWAGNGDVVAIKKSDLQDIDIHYLVDVLKAARYGQAEIDVISRALIRCGLDRH